MVIIIHHKNNIMLCALHTQIALLANGTLSDKRNLSHNSWGKLLLELNNPIGGALLRIRIINDNPLNLVARLVGAQKIQARILHKTWAIVNQCYNTNRRAIYRIQERRHMARHLLTNLKGLQKLLQESLKCNRELLTALGNNLFTRFLREYLEIRCEKCCDSGIQFLCECRIGSQSRIPHKRHTTRITLGLSVAWKTIQNTIGPKEFSLSSRLAITLLCGKTEMTSVTARSLLPILHTKKSNFDSHIGAVGYRVWQRLCCIDSQSRI